MVKNHLLSFIRNLSRNKGYAFINISGLAVGFAAALLISIYVFQEYNYDRHHKDFEKIYRLSASSFAFSSTAHLNYLRNHISGIDAAVSMVPTPGGTLKIDEDRFLLDGTYFVTEEYFKVFNQELIRGNSRTAFVNPKSIVLTESTAKKVFGRENPIGLEVDLTTEWQSESYTVTGVMKDPPLTSYLKFNILARLPKDLEGDPNDFFNTSKYCFFKTTNELNLVDFQAESDRLFAKRSYDRFERNETFDEYFSERRGQQEKIINIANLHLESDLLFEASPPGKQLYLQIFIGIALFIILLAAINYVNLSTAQASKRAKEIGVRKVLGSIRSKLVIGFLSESLMLTILSWIIGVFLAELLLELMTNLGFSVFNVSVFDFHQILLVVLAVSILTGLGAGIYPAFYLSGFVPALVLKGNYTSTRGKSLSRNLLVVFQFSISLTLAIFSIFVYQQLNYGLGKDLGFDKEQVIVIDNSKEQLGGSEEAFREELVRLSSVSNASFSRFSMIDRLSISGIMSLDSSQQHVRLFYKFGDQYFIPTMGFEILEGRNFDPNIKADTAALVVNESLARELGGSVVGREFNAFFLGDRVRIVGVVKDFHFQDFGNAIEPAGFFFRERGNQLNVRISDSRGLTDVEETWGQFTNEPFDFYFFDQRFNELFKAEQTLGHIITIFTSLSIFIAFLGFAGLISFQLDRRIKEIGIRKVLGASVTQILNMFSVEFSRLAIVSFLIGAPIAFYITSQWLKSFAYRVDVGIFPFLVAGIGGFLLILLIIVLRTRGKANANPVEILRAE